MDISFSGSAQRGTGLPKVSQRALSELRLSTDFDQNRAISVAPGRGEVLHNGPNWPLCKNRLVSWYNEEGRFGSNLGYVELSWPNLGQVLEPCTASRSCALDCLHFRLQVTQRPKNEVKFRCPAITARSLFGTFEVESWLDASSLLAPTC